MAYKQTPGLIADAFSGAFRQRLAQDQEADQFNRKMYEEQRQQGLMEFWRQQNFKADEAYRKATLGNQAIDNERQGKLVDAQLQNYATDNKLALDKFEWDKKQDGIRNSMMKEKLNSPQEMTSPGDFSKGFGLLGKAWSGYNQTLNPSYDTKTNEYYVSKGLGNKMMGYNKDDIKSLRQNEMNNVINESNSLVKEINASYPGFETYFNRAFQKIKNPQQIDAYVESIKDSKGNTMPSHLKDWMKEILKKRIF